MNRKLFVLTIGLFVAAFAQAQTAGIKASPVSGCAPLLVTFTDNSTGATSWNWNFGNGVTSNTQGPSTQFYVNAGIYTVTLSINGGASTTTQVITVFASPDVKFIVNDSSGCFPLNVQFTDQSTPGSSPLVAWRWDFGDGDTSIQRNPAHIYDGAANYPVTLQVIDQNGCSGVLTKTGYIKIPNGVAASFTTVASSGCKIPITINLNNTSTGPAGSALSYLWTFGDGTATSTTISPSHTYIASGTYDIKLVAVSSAGCTDSVTVPTNILAGNVSSSFTAPDTACVNSAFTIVNTSAPTPTVSNWSFGDGTSSSLISNITKAYSATGVYTIKLTNTFGACIDSVSKQITVLTPAVSNFTATNNVSCDSVFTVNFTDQSVNASSWFWNFGDGTTSTMENPTHTYTNYGVYSVTLNVANAVGCSGSLTKTAYVESRKPYILLSNLTSEGCAPFTFVPVLIDTVVDGISTYLWNFGDGTTSTSSTPPSHSYPSAGTYYVTLSITTNGGCAATTIDTIRVGTIKPNVAFTESPTTVCAGNPVVFTDQSTNNPNQWLWLFGDGNSSTAENPSYEYQLPGTYTVTLIAYNNGCNDSAKAHVVVNPPQAKFAYTFSCSDNSTVFDFHDSSKGADTWLWNFGDGTSSTVENPTHTYAAGVDSGYVVSLTVTNSATGCTNTYALPAYVAHQTGYLSLSAAKSCINQGVYISPGGLSAPSEIATYTFYYGDGTIGGPSAYPNGVNFHKYDSTGIFTYYVVLTEKSGCYDTLGPGKVQIDGPIANFVSSGYIGCTGLAATFTDLSKGDGISPIVQWIWNFGDSTPTQTYTGPPFTHNYSKQGIYTVTLKVVDGTGCYDSIAKINLITVAFPSANFTTVDSLTCPGSPIIFENNSKGYGLKYYWNFGDGSPVDSIDINPSHIYAFGNYKAALMVVDQYGCAAATNNYNIEVDTPTASFTINDTFASCPPLTADFTFTGSYYQTLRWTFGDGGISSDVNPTHFYTIPGNYTAGLVVTSPGGCMATAPNVNIKILGPYGALSYTPLVGCHVLPVNFTLTTGNNVTKYLWLFDQSNSDSTTVPTTSFTYDSVGKFVPVVVLTDSTGCNVPVIGTDTIYIQGSYPRFGYSTNVLCANGTVQFSDSTVSVGTVTGYQWNFGDGGTSNQENPSHYYASPGIYSVSLIVTVGSGCSDTVTVNNLIKVVTDPVIGITGDSLECAPASITFQGVILQADTSAFSWAWSFGNGQTDSAQNPPAQSYPTPGIDTVKLTATNSSNCSTTVEKVIQIDSIALTNAGADTAICLGKSAFLNATSSASPATFTWLPPTNGTLSCTTCNNPTATPDTTTTYYVQGLNSVGCGTIDSVVVGVVQPATLSVTPLVDSVCLGQQVQLNATGEAIYTWSPAAGLSNPSIGNPLASPDTTTTYQVTGSDSLYCFQNTQSVTVNVFSYPTLTLNPNVSIPIGTSFQITGAGSPDIDSIFWSPTVGLSCVNCLSPLASPLTTTTYVLRVENSGGCVTTDSIRIMVTCDGKNLFVPNTFSPNGDNMNDWFFIRGTGLSTVQSMRIFNRWGQLVFEKKNLTPNVQQDGWDGNYNGRPAPIDVYIYTIQVVCENSQVITYSGNVALIR